MIDRLIEWSASHRWLILGAVILGCLLGAWSMQRLPLDATPDQSDAQTILVAHWDRSPDIIEDQITYPAVSTLLGTPHVKTVRGISDFGASYIYVIFRDGVEVEAARAAVLQKVPDLRARLPEGATLEVGPDASALGWVYQYALMDTTHQMSLSDLRSYQDQNLRPALASQAGVAEIASVGGFKKQFEIQLDPGLLQAYKVPLRSVLEALRTMGGDSGGGLIEAGGAEFMVRGHGAATTLADLGALPVTVTPDGTTIHVSDIGQVTWSAEARRGVAELNGGGEVVSGIVVMRSGENVLDVVDGVKARLHALEAALPAGLKIVPVYDRSLLVREAVHSLRRVIVEIALTVALLVLLFLWHVPSAVIPLITLPVTLVLCFIPLHFLGVSANIMSLAGLAIALSELIDASMVVGEQVQKKLGVWHATGQRGDPQVIVLAAVKQVARPAFFALLVIAVSFLPVLTLEAQEGRLFRPLALSKTIAMLVAAALLLTLDPALRLFFVHREGIGANARWYSKIVPIFSQKRVASEQSHFIMGPLMRLYTPIVRFSLARKWEVISMAVLMIAVTIPVFFHLGSELMPPLSEGTILYMPSTLPGISVAQATALLTVTDGILKTFPEVQSVLGKAGRADTATDPAPLSMLETVITLRPQSQWPRLHTWYSDWTPRWAGWALLPIAPDTRTPEQLVSAMDRALNVPGLVNSWNMPIKGRNDMLSTGIRTSLGVKVSGPDVATIAVLAKQVETILAKVPGTRTVVADRLEDGRYLDVDWNRVELGRVGLSMGEVQEVLQYAVGGEPVATTLLGRSRYPIAVRYAQEFRNDPQAIERLPVTSPSGQVYTLGQFAKVRTTAGPDMVRDEDGRLTANIALVLDGVDPGHYADLAAKRLSKDLVLPPNCALTWSGQYEGMLRVKKRLQTIVPVTILLVFLLLMLNTRSSPKTLIILLAMPFSAVGAVWFLYFAGYNVSVAVWVGILALLGVDAETGMFMLLYLDLAYEEAKRGHRMQSLADLREAIIEGASKRLRPKVMTFAATTVGLLPILWATGAGADLMRRIAAPMIGGIFTSFLLELLVYPAIYEAWRWHTEVKRLVSTPQIAVQQLAQA